MPFTRPILTVPLLSLAALAAVPEARAAKIDNNSVWRDTDGQEIKAQGGCILLDSGVYHWIGPGFEADNYRFHAINHYASTDLQAWKKQPPLLTPDMAGLAAGMKREGPRRYDRTVSRG